MCTIEEFLISSKTKEAFSELFAYSYEKTLEEENINHDWDINCLNQEDSLSENHNILITICSYKIRIFATMHYSSTSENIHYVSNVLQKKPEEITEEMLKDYFSECCNRYSGNLKKGLMSEFPHLGMSTPDILKQASFEIFQTQEYPIALKANLKSASQVTFSFGLFVLTSQELDFSIELDNSEAGVLELF